MIPTGNIPDIHPFPVVERSDTNGYTKIIPIGKSLPSQCPLWKPTTKIWRL